MKTLVINADDFGLTEGVCVGIVNAIEKGALMTTTAMMCVPGSQNRVAFWGRRIPKRIGLHLQLTSGRPLLNPKLVPSLVRADGTFPDSRKEPLRRKPEEILMEWHAQMHALRKGGIEPTHLDTHHHIHLLADVFDTYLDFASCYRIPTRAVDPERARGLRAAGLYTVDRTLIDWFGGDLTAARLLEVVQNGSADLVEDGCVIELMTHPGIADEELPPLSRYVHDRDRELGALCEPGLAQRLEDAGFRLASFQELRARSSARAS